MNKFKQYIETHNMNDFDEKYALIVLFLIVNGHNKNDDLFFKYGYQIYLIMEMYDNDFDNLKYVLNMHTKHIDIYNDDVLMAYIFYDKFLNYYFDYMF